MYKQVSVEDLHKQKQEIYKLHYEVDRKLYNKELNKLLKKIQYWSDDVFRAKKTSENIARNSLIYGTDEYRTYQREYHRIYRDNQRNKCAVV